MTEATADRQPSKAAMNAASRAWYRDITTQPTVHGQIEELALALDVFATAASEAAIRECAEIAKSYANEADKNAWDGPMEVPSAAARRVAGRILSLLKTGATPKGPTPIGVYDTPPVTRKAGV